MLIQFFSQLRLMILARSLIFFTALTPVFALAGGSDVGGGGVLRLPHASIDQVKESAARSRQILKLWLHGQEAWSSTHPDDITPAYSKLFRGPRSIYDVLDNLKIEFRLNKACYDKEGSKHDGSIYTSLGTPDSICLSGARMALALRTDNYDYGTIALILHEVSHLLGTTEVEARKIQADIIQSIRSWDLRNHSWVPNFDADSGNFEFESKLVAKEMNDSIKIHDPDLSTNLTRVWIVFDRIFDFKNRGFSRTDSALMSPLTPVNVDRAFSLEARLFNLRLAACDQSRWPDCTVRYASLFSGAPTVTAVVFFGELGDFKRAQKGLPYLPGWPTHGQFINETIPFIDNVEALRAEYNNIMTEYKILAAEAHRLFNEPVIEMIEK